MKVRKLNILIIVTSLVLAAALAGCSSTPKAEPQAAAAPQFEKYHDIVDVKFVMDHTTVPMAEDVMIIDARPKRAKYDKGHIPGRSKHSGQPIRQNGRPTARKQGCAACILLRRL